jgi:hypothetical protein
MFVHRGKIVLRSLMALLGCVFAIRQCAFVIPRDTVAVLVQVAEREFGVGESLFRR